MRPQGNTTGFFLRAENRAGAGALHLGLCLAKQRIWTDETWPRRWEPAAHWEGIHQMLQHAKRLLLASCLLAIPYTTAIAAEREDVRKVINLVSAVKMPYPEGLSRNRRPSDLVWLERDTTTTGCIRLEERRWCYEHIPPQGNRAEMLRIRNEPSRGVYIGAMYYYIVDLDLDGLVDVGSTTRIEELDQRRPATPIGHVIQFFHRSTKRAEQSVAEYQKMYDEGLQIALKYFGEWRPPSRAVEPGARGANRAMVGLDRAYRPLPARSIAGAAPEHAACEVAPASCSRWCVVLRFRSTVLAGA